MSGTQDDYAPPHTIPDRIATSNDTEPADPSDCDHSPRRDLPLAPDSVKTEPVPDPFITDGRVETVAQAGKTYLKYQYHIWKKEDNPSKHERHRFQTYPRLQKADRLLQERYEGNLTTAMLTRRLSPLDDRGNWMTPWECNEMLHGGSIHRSVNQALRYNLGDFEFVWAAVTAPTRSAGTPHEHIYLWINDPENAVTVDHLKPALGKHLKYCDNAYRNHHRYRPDGTGGALTVYHTPPLIEFKPERLMQMLDDDTPNRPSTTGAQYLASQLAHLPIRDYYKTERTTPPMTLFEGAALAWASPYNWLRTGSEFPI